MLLTSKQDKQFYDHSFPTFQLFVLALCRIAEPIALTSIFPYAFPMVKGFLGDDNPNNALYTGVLISSFSLAEAATGMFWGGLSDRIGRKPVLLLGLFGTMISLLMTGIAQSFTFALIARLLGGLLNGNIGVIQTMVGELVKNPDHEPRAFAIMPFTWCIGSIIGPAIAGMTSNSALSPNLPYLLPNLIGAGFLLFGIIIGLFFLQETFERQDVILGEEKQLLLPNDEPRAQAFHDAERTESYGTFNWVNFDQGETSSLSSINSKHYAKAEKASETVFSKRVLLLISALCFWCYHTMAYDHLLPIFLQDDRIETTGTDIFFIPGGIGLSTEDVGMIMAVNGVIALVVQGLLFPLMTDLFGIWHTFVAVMVFHPLAYLVIPYIAFLSDRLVFPGIYTCLLLRNLFYIPAYPLLIILIKEAANPKHLGRINGLAASTGAVARMLGPPVGGLLYGVGSRVGFTGLAWWGTGIVAIVGAVQVLWLKRAKNKHTTVEMPFAAVIENENEHGAVTLERREGA